MGDAAEAAVELDLRLISVRRPSIICENPNAFVDVVAEQTEGVVDELGLELPVLLGWSGGTPYALATAIRLGSRVPFVHLVSPVRGTLTGPRALGNQSERLRDVAQSTAESPWISGPAALRDYQAVTAPWPIEVESALQDVIIWSPSDDEIVPPPLLKDMAARMPRARVIEVSGTHGWLTENWAAVLTRL